MLNTMFAGLVEEFVQLIDKLSSVIWCCEISVGTFVCVCVFACLCR